MFKPDNVENNALGAIKAVRKDRKGNVFQVAFGSVASPQDFPLYFFSGCLAVGVKYKS
jgi:hypothetical protein